MTKDEEVAVYYDHEWQRMNCVVQLQGGKRIVGSLRNIDDCLRDAGEGLSEEKIGYLCHQAIALWRKSQGLKA